MKPIAFLGLLACCALPAAAADENIHIELAKPSWQLPRGVAVLAGRDSQLSAGEQPLALMLRPLLAEEKYDEAMALLEREKPASPSAALWLLQGQLAQQLKRPAEAIEAYQQALKELPDFARAHRALALVYFTRENYRQAHRHMARAIALGLSDDVSYGQLGFMLLKDGQHQAAAQAYSQALVLAPDNRDWQSGLLYALTESGQYERAAALLGDQINRRSDDAGLWLQRARLQINRQQPKEALASLEVALRLGPVSAANRRAAAQLHLQMENYPRAFELLKQNLAAGEADMAYLSRISEWLISEQLWREADQLRRAIEPYSKQLNDADNARRLYLAAEIDRHKGKPEAAQQQLSEALALAPTFAPAIMAKAKLSAANGAYAEAEALYSRAAALPGYRAQALTGRAQVLIDQARYSEALSLLRELYREQPSDELSNNIRTLRRVVEQSAEG